MSTTTSLSAARGSSVPWPVRCSLLALPLIAWSPVEGVAALANAAPQEPTAQQEPQDPPEGRRGRPRDRGQRPRVAEQASPFDAALADPAARERSAQALRQLARTLGTAAWTEADGVAVDVDLWSSLPGLRFQLLETLYVEVPAEPSSAEGQGAAPQGGASGAPRLRVHHRLPRLVHLAPPNSGYVNSELVHASADNRTYTQSYLRAVVDGPVAWTEQQQSFNREGDAAARQLLWREMVQSALPLCLGTVQPEVAYLRSFEGADVHALRLARPLRVGDAETAREVALYLDPTSGVPLQWQFQSDYMRSSGQTSGYTLDFGEWERWHRVPIPAEVQEQLRQRLVEAWAEARLAARRATGNGEEPSAEWLAQRPDPAQLHVPQEFRLPWKRLLGLDSGQQLTEFWLEQPAVVGLPEGALERPWMSGALWAAAERADHWDPPAAQR